MILSDRYGDAERELVWAEYAAIVRAKSPHRSHPADWLRLLRLLLEHALEQDPASGSLLAKHVSEGLFGVPTKESAVSANKTILRAKLAEYEKEAGPKGPFRIEVAAAGYEISFTRRALSARFLPEWLAAVFRFFEAPAEIPISPALFMVAVVVPALWVLLCRWRSWSYYLGGSGNEPDGWHALIWGGISTIPVASYMAGALWRTHPILVRPATALRIARLLAAQTAAGAIGAWLFYVLGLRAIVERWRLPATLQEWAIGFLWSALCAGPLLLAVLAFFRWRALDLLKETGRIAMSVSVLAAAFQMILPSSHTPAECVPHLAADPAAGIVLRAAEGCRVLGGSFVFDQARGLLAGVALPFFTLYVLMRFVKGVHDGAIGPRAQPRGPLT